MPKTTYLKSFTFPSNEQDSGFCGSIQRSAYDSFYPFGVLSSRGLRYVEFEPVTIFYGGNGSGKTTALNVIAEKTGVQRGSVYNKSNFFPDYVKLCQVDTLSYVPRCSRIITSDDVFDYMLDMRNYNQAVDRRRDKVFMEWVEYTDPFAPAWNFGGMEDYDELKLRVNAKKQTQSRYTRDRLGVKNVIDGSNGETAFRYFVEKIGDGGLYLLDEPENSLSPSRQLELVKFMEESARFFECQFIISTHSPFLLAMKDAKIYDLDSDPARVRQWTELENVRAYRDFFKEREGEF